MEFSFTLPTGVIRNLCSRRIYSELNVDPGDWKLKHNVACQIDMTSKPEPVRGKSTGGGKGVSTGSGKKNEGNEGDGTRGGNNGGTSKVVV